MAKRGRRPNTAVATEQGIPGVTQTENQTRQSVATPSSSASANVTGTTTGRAKRGTGTRARRTTGRTRASVETPSVGLGSNIGHATNLNQKLLVQAEGYANAAIGCYRALGMTIRQIQSDFNRQLGANTTSV
jgi:hypothetical protein